MKDAFLAKARDAGWRRKSNKWTRHKRIMFVTCACVGMDVFRNARAHVYVCVCACVYVCVYVCVEQKTKSERVKVKKRRKVNLMPVPELY